MAILKSSSLLRLVSSEVLPLLTTTVPWVISAMEAIVTIKYVKTDTAKLIHTNSAGKESSIQLLWGDRVKIESENGSQVFGKARGFTGSIDKNALCDESLLELYFIDVGQGDSVFIRTPDDRHLLIDGGLRRSDQPTHRSAADFVDWKFVEDYGLKEIHLDAMIASHCDADHFGGLWDLVDPKEKQELDATTRKVDNFYHAGVSWWKKNGSSRTLGRIQDHCLIDLLGNRSSAESALGNQGGQKLVETGRSS